jgi:hypothetical protein
MNILTQLFLEPFPIRSAIIRLIRKLGLCSYQQRLQIGAVERPHYGYCVYQAAMLAKKLGYPRISVLEFGVAGGRGLLNLEYHARQVESLLSIEIEIYGFDTGEGLPKPSDYRDLPYHWKEGFFNMDIPHLRSKLKRAKLIIGDIAGTAKSFLEEYNPAPIAAVMHDFDFYSSTALALQMFDEDEKYFLPRVYCYFDDTVGTETELYNDYTGERLAINEFNQTHSRKKFAIPYHLLARKAIEPWHHQIFVYHDFEHSRYNDFISEENQQLHLTI